VSVQSAESEGAAHERKTITILVNNRPVALHEARVTGAQIKAAADVPGNFKLYGPEGNEIRDDERVEVREGERFTAISGQDVSCPS
jgi:hypothetical protein